MVVQTDIRDILGEVQQGPLLSTHRGRIKSLMEHFASAGLERKTCADARHLNRSLSTVKGYARDFGLKFSDYVPLALRPPKPPKAKKRRRAAARG